MNEMSIVKGPKISRRWSRADKVLMSGLLNFYGANYTDIENVFSEFPTRKKVTRSKVSPKGDELRRMSGLQEFPELKDKDSFSKFFINYFKSLGIADPLNKLLPILEKTAFISQRTKIIYVGLNIFFDFSGSSIKRIIERFGETKIDHDYANRILKEYSTENNEIRTEIDNMDKETFVLYLAQYLSLDKDQLELLKMVLDEEFKNRKIEYSEDERKIIWGLATVAGFKPKYIAKIVSGMGGNLSDITPKEVKNSYNKPKSLGMTVEKEELEKLLGMSLEDIPIIFGNDEERISKPFTRDEQEVVLGWFEYIGSSESLARFFKINFNYSPKNVSNFSSLAHKAKKRGVKTPTREDFEKKLKQCGYENIEDVLKEFQLSETDKAILFLLNLPNRPLLISEMEREILISYIGRGLDREYLQNKFQISENKFRWIIEKGRELGKVHINERQSKQIIPGMIEDRTEIDKYQEYLNDQNIESLVSKILNKVSDKKVNLPLAISVTNTRNLLRPNGIDEIGQTCIIKLSIVQESKKLPSNSQGETIKKQIRALAYFLSRPGKLEQILNILNTYKKTNLAAIVLDVGTVEVRNSYNGFVHVYKSIYKNGYIDPTAKLDTFI